MLLLLLLLLLHVEATACAAVPGRRRVVGLWVQKSLAVAATGASVGPA